MRKDAVKQILEQDLFIRADKVEELLTKMRNAHPQNKRNGKRQRPAGGISIRNASRKYKLSHTTISGWVTNGIIPTLHNTSKERYILEELIAFIAQRYTKGRGKRTIKEIMADWTTNHDN